ncbi:hypothetical protein GALMADRAFT_161892 [Galerina marginata CBS 339.88]|uniref:Uncharacterized protein n=1 Tax=Galerina marginata (strain CBS 339.88) TaxID=685588 RepID=A0A067S831_GALM3|nr:hypothetical protein GALMADRAFT_161892 [Galerina marginata CBS 339.88]
MPFLYLEFVLRSSETSSTIASLGGLPGPLEVANHIDRRTRRTPDQPPSTLVDLSFHHHTDLPYHFPGLSRTSRPQEIVFYHTNHVVSHVASPPSRRGLWADVPTNLGGNRVGHDEGETLEREARQAVSKPPAAVYADIDPACTTPFPCPVPFRPHEPPATCRRSSSTTAAARTTRSAGCGSSSSKNTNSAAARCRVEATNIVASSLSPLETRLTPHAFLALVATSLARYPSTLPRTPGVSPVYTATTPRSVEARSPFACQSKPETRRTNTKATAFAFAFVRHSCPHLLSIPTVHCPTCRRLPARSPRHT